MRTQEKHMKLYEDANIENFDWNGEYSTWWLPQVEEIDEKIDASRIAEAAFTRLSERKSEILKRHFWDKESFEQIGKSFGISGSRASEIMQKALKELRFLFGFSRVDGRRLYGYPYQEPEIPELAKIVKVRCLRCGEILKLSEQRVRDLLRNPRAKMCNNAEPGSPHVALKMGGFCDGTYGIERVEKEN